MSEAPRLNGWITPEYAEQMVMDLLIFLKKKFMTKLTQMRWLLLVLPYNQIF